MKSKNYFFLALTVLFLILFSCSSTKRDDQSITENSLSLIKDKNVKLLIVYENKEELNANWYFEGGAGLIDMWILGPSKELSGLLKKEQFVKYISSYYVPKIKENAKKFNYSLLPSMSLLQEEKLPKEESKNEKLFRLNLRNQFTKEKAHYALVIKPYRFGIIRKVFGPIPLSGYNGISDFSVTLVNLKTNIVVAHNESPKIKTPEGDWSNPPQYSQLMKSIGEASELAAIKNIELLFPYE
ncbi:MAG: hypothetical protein QE271_01210 [Bacteriovoracaceae bacterium]|nr:hypothetical protein [Bacteriovoracaceae bacterium]